MTKIVIEFGTPNARKKAGDWRKEIVDAVEKTMAEIGHPEKTPVFSPSEYSVYMTFEE